MIPRQGRLAWTGGIGLMLVWLGAVGALARLDPRSLREGGTRGSREEVTRLRGELELARLELSRLRAVVDYSDHHRVPAGLAGLIWDIALAERVDPALAFALVRIESGFDPLAVSRAGAVGLTQLMPRTAALLRPGVTYSELFEPSINLRLGLRHLRFLLQETGGDTTAALLKYNGCVRAPGCRSYPDIVLAVAAGRGGAAGDAAVFPAEQ